MHFFWENCLYILSDAPRDSEPFVTEPGGGLKEGLGLEPQTWLSPHLVELLRELHGHCVLGPVKWDPDLCLAC